MMSQVKISCQCPFNTDDACIKTVFVWLFLEQLKILFTAGSGLSWTEISELLWMLRCRNSSWQLREGWILLGDLS